MQSGYWNLFRTPDEYAVHKETDDSNHIEAVVEENVSCTEIYPVFYVKPFVSWRMESSARQW